MSRTRWDILALLTPTLSGTKDTYGNNVISPLPLSLDRVNEGRFPSSDAAIFRLPVELLSKIILCVPQESLASLALVNKDCCQWARSRLFSSVCLDYNARSWSLIARLYAEAQERLYNQGRTILPSLGACIRHLTVATNPRWLEMDFGIAIEVLESISLEETKSRLDAASSEFFDT
jgi:hypothetical protein